MRRTVLAVSLLAVTAGLAAPSFAAITPPVGVVIDTHDGVFVGTTINGQPGASISDRHGVVCPGFSYETARCIDTNQR